MDWNRLELMADGGWIGPALGLVGTIAATGVGLYQWRKTDKKQRNIKLNQKRAETLQELVARFQDLQLQSRRRTIHTSQLDEQAQQLNSLLIENRLWLNDSDERIVREYLDALRMIHDAMYSAAVADFNMYIDTAPEGLYADSVAHLFKRLGRAERSLIDLARKAMRNT